MKKDSPFKRFRRALTLGLATLFVIQNFAVTNSHIKQSRMYRDIMGQTPFYDVEVYSSVVSSTGIIVQGEMKKRRCEFGSLVAYTLYAVSANKRTYVDTSVEDNRSNTKGNRPPSKDAQSWGPWRIVSLGVPSPDGWEIYVTHTCPVLGTDGVPLVDKQTQTVLTKLETNLFASGKWETTKE